MKACGKRIVYLVLALALTVSLLGTAAFAEETTTGFKPENSYVFEFRKDLKVKEYAYFSPYVPQLTYDGGVVDGFGILFGLRNSYTDEMSEIAYCVDMPVDAEGGIITSD